MKKVLLGLLLLGSISVNSQIKREKFIDKEAGGNVTLKYQRSVDLDKGDTTYMVYFIFQNAKYTSITDTKIIAFYEKSSIAQLMKDMKSAYKQMITGEKVSIDWNREKYKLNLYDFSNDLYLIEGKGTGGYTMMSKKDVADLMEALSTIDFGMGTLLPAKTIDELIQ
jgi:hypothetical protein